MSEERQRVLRMLKEGKVSIEEAEALLEALAEAEGAEVPGGPPGNTAGHAATGTVGETAAGLGSRTAPETEAGAEERRGFDLLLDDIMRAVDVEGLVTSVRESLRRSGVDMRRVKEEVRRATHVVRDETRRVAQEYRRQAWGGRISRAIDGLWGLVPAAGSWSHEADLPPGQSLEVHNIWGDVRIKASDDDRLRVAAVIRAWGRDEAEAAALRDAVRIRTVAEGTAFKINVEAPPEAGPRRFRVDFDLHIPSGVAVEVTQTRGDVAISGARGDVRVKTSHGDITVSAGVGRIHAESKHGDIVLRQPAGPVWLELETARGDIRAEVERFVAGTASRMTAMSGDLSIRLTPQTRCRITARATSGEIHAGAPMSGTQPGRRSLQGVYGSAEANLELSTLRGDISIAGPGADVRPEEASSTVGAD